MRSADERVEGGGEAGGPAVLRWAQAYLPEYFTDEPCRFHAELLADLEAGTQRLIARVAPRGHAKSTCAALAFPLWCVCEGRRRNIVIITHEASLATQFVTDIRTELECNAAILRDYGDLCRGSDERAADAGRRRQRGRWSQGLLITTTGVAVQAKSTGASFRGTKVGPHRPDLIICDDIEKDEFVESAEGRRKLEHWLRRVVMPALTPAGQLVVLGSIIHHDSLLANLRDRQRWPRWDYRVYRALEAAADGAGGFWKVALWPARWPAARLVVERERLGSLAFEQEYQANPIDDSVRVFQPSWLGRYDPAELAGQTLYNVMAVDPATGASGGDYFAIWVGSVGTATGRIYTRYLSCERIGIVQQIKRILAVAQRWQPLRIGVETVAYQVVLKEILEEESRKQRLYLPIVGLKTTANKRARIEALAPLFENGTLLLPADLPDEIAAQFLHFPKARHDDGPDACAMGVEVLRSLGGPVEGAVTAGRAGDRVGW